MENSLLKKLLPHGIALVVMLVVAFGFFAPFVFDGKVLQQGDNQKAAASQAEMDIFKAKTGNYPLWTNAYFAGMPTVQIHQEVKGNLTQPIFRASLLGQSVTAPHTNILLAMLSMYILLLVLGIDWRLGLIGAVGFGLSSFNMDIIEAGHSTKMVALAYAPLVLAGAFLTFRGKQIVGGGVFALAVALQLYANHYQITYYTFLILLVFGIVELVGAARSGHWFAFGKSVAALAVGLALGVGSNMAAIWTTQEYQTETQRGVSELASTTRPKGGGLDKTYATDWSYGVGELLTTLVQNTYGGGASQTHAATETFEKVSPQIVQGMQGVAPDKALIQADKQISGLFYTGSQPYVGVSIYFGAIFVFLFIVGLQLVEGKNKWWLAVATLVMLMISVGKNFFFFDIMFDYFPMFNKFRAVTQALGLGQLLFIVLASLSLQSLFTPSVFSLNTPEGQAFLAKKNRALLIGAGITAAFCLLAMAVGGGVGKQDAQLQQGLISMLQSDREALARADALRSLALVALSGGLIWLAINGRLKTAFAVAGIGALTLFDSWTVAKRILPADKFETKQEATEGLGATAADKKIQADPDPDFRVLDLRGGSPFTNAATSAFHKSVGGYHAAKLMRYQELIEKYLGDFKKDVPILAQSNMPIYGALNAKYVILDDSENGVQANPYALGNAWFVKNVKVVETADAELEELGKLNPRTDAVFSKKYADKIGGVATPQYDSTATIKLTAYNPDRLDYEYSAKNEQVAVFSEIYYPMEKGWELTVDGNEAKFTKADYTLRAAKLPAGTHKVAMIFRPRSYYVGETISLLASVILLLLFISGLFLYFRKNGLPKVTHLPEAFAAAEKRKTTTPSVQTPSEKPKAKPTLREQPKKKK